MTFRDGMSKRQRDPTRILLRALRVIRGSKCSNVTTPGHGHCFRAGRIIGTKYTADRACDACIADRLMIEDLHFHDTRAEALTRLARKVDVLTLAKISGHKDLRILQNAYYRETAEQIAARL